MSKVLTNARIGELVRASLQKGHMQRDSSTREYFCPLNPYPRDRMSHRIALDYWVARPPVRADIIRRFAEHLDPDSEECEYVTAADGDAREADRRAGRSHGR